MRVEVNINLEVDPDANFLECNDETSLEVLMGIIKNALYDVDDINITYIELEKV